MSGLRNREHMKLAILLIALVGCSVNARHDTLKAMLATTDAAEATYVAYDRHHQLELVDKAPDRAAAEKELADWRATQAKILRDFALVYQAIAVAWSVNDDAAVANAGAAAQTLTADMKAAKVSP